MTADDLSAPLGRKPVAQRFAWLSHWPQALAGVLGAFLLAFTGWALFSNDPLGGEPMARVTIAPPPTLAEPPPPATKTQAPSPPKQDPAAAAIEPAAAPPGTRTVTVIDGSSGRRQDVIVREPKSAPAPGGAALRLVEVSRHGPIPKIAEDGARPAEVYAKPSKARTANAVRVAIVVGGLGTSALRTTEAIDKLPEAVTLAFMPYAKDIEQWVARANQAGRELLLQAPMEPFDYPDNDPGPQTLLTSLGAEQNIDRLHWFMSRFQGYVGVVNHAGGRFTASEQAFSPVLREVGRRGLIYLDDGISARSVAGQIAGANNLAYAKADIVLDASPTSADLDAALSRLEAMARERGLAIGYSNAAPVVVDRIGRWAKQLEERGIVLVPLSAAVQKPKSS